MAAVTAEVAFNTARTLLNDDAGVFYTDGVLLPKLVEAFRMLEAKLRVTDGSIMKDEVTVIIGAGAALYSPLPTNIIEPIVLWEKLDSAPITAFIKMTEKSILPFQVPGVALDYWQWDGTNVNFIIGGASSNRAVKLQYFGELAEPTGPGDSLVFIQAEYYLGPMTAAVMAGSLGELEIATACQTQADATLSDIIMANRGRIAPPGSVRP